MSSAFARLASVAVQLILQLLDNASRFSAARCSHALMREACAPFSWLYAEPLQVSSFHADCLTPMRSPLLQHAPVHLRVSSSDADVLQRISQVGSVRVLRVHTVGRPRDTSEWISVIVSPTMRRLQQLHFAGTVHEHIMRAICALPALSTLRLDALLDGRSLTPLSLTLPSTLTDLRINLGGRYMPNTMAAIAACQTLCALEFGDVWWRAGDWARFLCSPNMARLQQLTLLGLTATVLSAEEIQDVFRTMTQLRVLRLKRVQGVPKLLAHAHLSPSLRLVEIIAPPAACVWTDDDERSMIPSPAVIESLLAASIGVHLNIYLSDSLDEWKADAGVTVERKRVLSSLWQRLQAIAALPRASLLPLKQEYE